MRVICIHSTVYVTGKDRGATSIQKGSIYHVINTLTGEEVREMYKHTQAANGTWYELLELPGHHFSERFLEIPDDESEVEVNTNYIKETV